MERGSPSQAKIDFIRYLLDLLEREGLEVTLYDEPANPQIIFPLQGSLWRLRASAIEPYYEHDQG
ncbi:MULTISPECIES: hypothetical protein [unclassified Meiothermus]|uniref:hypothetical protein n=1 Tax=unclassified Meiothermus TaxID=370471 RepID=UPI000D7CF0D1|nr:MULTISPECIES: hypothetical protein [unclassified Meiothermus]PZA05767.1 hypothetical protein DNA98_17055 [Meiothermus sp. Pnk-1]RYM32223.1 hypothetical protein EWH23_14275 [Meiothermus sp. PNK-Is4]